MHGMKLFAAAFAGVGFSAVPVFAHPGDHAHLTFETLASHLLEPDHLTFIALMVVIGVLAFAACRPRLRQAEKQSKQ
jgi:hypothetical protein